MGTNVKLRTLVATVGGRGLLVLALLVSTLPLVSSARAAINPATTLSTKSVTPGTTVAPGTSVTVTVTETNSGTDPLTGVSVTGGGACAGLFTPAGPISLASLASADFTCVFNAGAAGVTLNWTADGQGTDSLGSPVPTTGEHQAGSVNVTSPATGRMTGGGRITDSTVVTHGFDLHCDPARLPNNLQVNWAGGNRFHLTQLTSVRCIDDPNIAPPPPAAGFDTYIATGTGRYNGVAGATISFTFTDAGEPGTSDTATLLIKDVNGNVVLNVSGTLRGNHQAHAQ